MTTRKPVKEWTPTELLLWSAMRTEESAERYEREPHVGAASGHPTATMQREIAARFRQLADMVSGFRFPEARR